MTMNGIVDFHSHILPQIDDGSASIEESIAMLRLEAEQGIHHVVATPHFYAQHDSMEEFLARRAESEMRLREELEKHKDLPDITVGAEVYFFRGISESDVLQKLTIGKSPYCLIEMPMATWTDSMYRELENIYTYHGLTPILAHIERYLDLQTRDSLNSVLEQDVLVRHGEKIIQLENRSFEGIRAYLEQHCIEGIVFWKDGMPGCKIKRRDIGFMWPETKAISHDSENEV